LDGPKIKDANEPYNFNWASSGYGACADQAAFCNFSGVKALPSFGAAVFIFWQAP
jgi:hypothetical protein